VMGYLRAARSRSWGWSAALVRYALSRGWLRRA